MNQYPLWRYILLIVLVVLGVLYALPVLYGEDPAVQITAKDSAPLNVSVLTKVEDGLHGQKILYKSAKLNKDNILVRFKDTETQLKAQDVIQAVLGPNYSVALNLAPKTPKWLLAIGAHPMKLGLDLRGGVHFLFDVDVNQMLTSRQKSDVQSISQDLRQKRIRYSSLKQDGTRGITVGFRNENAKDDALSLIKSKFPNYTIKDVSKNGRYLIQMTMSENALMKLRTDAVQQNLTILRNRVNELGVAEPEIQQQGASQISVDLPGIQDMARAKDLIGKMATVKLQLVDTEHDALSAQKSGVIPFGTQLFKDENGTPILLKNQVVLSGQAIINAHSGLDQNGQPAVFIQIGGSTVPFFNRITGENVGKPLAVVYVETKTTKKLVDGKVVPEHKLVERVINVANIQSALGNNFQVMGLQSMEYAKNLALLLRSGAYKARMVPVQERVVGPSLGKENIRMGVLSTEIGSLLVIIFMAIYYRVFGLVADMALVLNIIFIVAIMSVLNATLTLPGIAAIVLTVGMAVDANVLINERIREELRNGMSPQASIYAGYERAFSTIVDANVTTLIVAVVLLAFGTGPVQGFAVTLIIGLLTSMVTAIFFTRAVINLVYGKRTVGHLSIGIKVKNK